jgi:hypothetical protein
MNLADEVYVIETPQCSWCGNAGIIEAPAKEFFVYQLGGLIQDAFVSLSAPLREQLKTGYHPQCWTEMFGEHK